MVTFAPTGLDSEHVIRISPPELVNFTAEGLYLLPPLLILCLYA